MRATRTILHPTDFSDYSDTAFRLACSLARDYGAHLVVMHVADLPLAVAAEGVLMAPPPMVDLVQLRERLEQLPPRDPQVSMECLLVQGDPAEEILRAAEKTEADLIAIGTHGRTGLGRVLMGSVAEQVVRKATCPVLTVKTPKGRVLSSDEPAPARIGAAAAV